MFFILATFSLFWVSVTREFTESYLSQTFKSPQRVRSYQYIAGMLVFFLVKRFSEFMHTKNNLIFLTQKVKEGFNEKKNTPVIFTDVASAFDKVWYKSLIYKMATLKIPYYLIKTIEEFLQNWSFFVQINHCCSDRRPLQCRVHQGGVLSPTLFNIYVNDLPIRNSDYIESTANDYSVLFADDLA